ncbi:MAG TPA: alpha-glucosidase/alpha-galactosidase [Clostridia bacterium]|nr:alpha-glucosidase/alpha-galactosidase [Clostridia bacterium]
MIRNGNQISGLRIAYIGGGSRNWAWNLMSDLALEEALGGEVLLYDIDFQAAKANEIIGNGIPESKERWTYRAVQSLPEALRGADFVIISILPGTFDEMAVDIGLPEQYGIYQSVGDTVGPGGILRAMRTLPMFHEMAVQIRDCCPEAWVINYTNPMTLCVAYMYKVWPGIKLYGCCHELFGLQHQLAALVNREWKPEIPATYKDIAVNPLGINHFTWVDQAAYQGKNVLPLFTEYARKYREEGFVISEEDEHSQGSYFGCLNRVKFDLHLRYGLVPAGGDRHMAEFCPQWYLKSPENVGKWGFKLTPVSWRKEAEAARREKSRAIVAGERRFDVHPSGEDEIGQIRALLGLQDFITNVNMPNIGQIENLPMGAVVETNVAFGHNSVRHLMAGRIPDKLNALIYRHVVNQQTLVDAVYERDLAKAFDAFANDALVGLALSDAKALFDAMVKGTRAYLDWWF